MGYVRVLNRCGFQAEAEDRVAHPQEGQIPVGTMVSIQPSEVMVKRGQGFDTANNNWEYVTLSYGLDGTRVVQRGATEVQGRDETCFNCHKAARAYDFICGDDHGCAKLPLDSAQLSVGQWLDARCVP